MTKLSSLRAKRILAVDPTQKGFGFAIFDGPETLVDWGLKRAKEKSKYLQRAAELIRRYQPEVLVAERTTVPSCRRRARARRMICDLLALGRRHRLRVRQVSRRGVLECFSTDGSSMNKSKVSSALAVLFPELARHLPPPRKLWMAEKERMGIFDAAAFGWTAYESFRREARALNLLSVETAQIHV